MSRPAAGVLIFSGEKLLTLMIIDFTAMVQFTRVVAWMFWLSTAGVLYAYVAYPIILWGFSHFFKRRSLTVPLVEEAMLPSVSLLIAAHNEELVIKERILNALALDYPPSKLEIVIASDGSIDKTAAIVAQYSIRGVRLIDNTTRRGKASVLNRAMGELSGEIVLFSDANTFTDPGAVRSLVKWFSNPRIGAVCGRLILVDPESGKNVDGMYWKYETFLKRCESKLGALLGSNGAIYAIRKSLYCPIPDQTIVDDFVIPLLVKSRSGHDIIYDPDATAQEESAPDVSSEFRRRARIGAGGWQAISILWRLLNPMRGWVAFTFFSHKVLRWLCPFFLLLSFFLNLALLNRPIYQLMFACTMGLYLAAIFGAYVPSRLPMSKLFRLAYMFVAMNAALLVGFARWMAGSQGGTWNRTQREQESQPQIPSKSYGDANY